MGLFSIDNKVSIDDAANSVKAMFIGIVLIIIWLPSIIISEKNNKGNKEETESLIKTLNNEKILNKVKNGIISSNNNKFININDIRNTVDKYRRSINKSNENYPNNLLYYKVKIELKKTIKEEKVKKHKNKDTGKITESITWVNKSFKSNNWPYNELQKSQSDTIKKNKLNVEYNKKILSDVIFKSSDGSVNLSNINIETDLYKFIDRRNNIYTLYENGRDRTYIKYDLEISESFLPKSKLNNITYTGYLKDNRNKYNFGSQLEFNIDKFYSGSIDDTKQKLLQNRESSSTIQKWIIRFITLIILSTGLHYLIEPIRVLIHGSSDVLEEVPILNLIVPFVNIFGGFLLGLYSVFNFLASIILTLIFTFIVYYFVNYPIITGISLFVFIIISVIFKLLKKI